MRHVQRVVIQRVQEHRNIAGLGRDACGADTSHQRLHTVLRCSNAFASEIIQSSEDGRGGVFADMRVVDGDGLPQAPLEDGVPADAEDDGVDEGGWRERVAESLGYGGDVFDVAGVDGEVRGDGRQCDGVVGTQHVDELLRGPGQRGAGVPCGEGVGEGRVADAACGAEEGEGLGERWRGHFEPGF